MSHASEGADARRKERGADWQRLPRALTVLLLASVSVGGECQEYLDHVAAQEAAEQRRQQEQRREALLRSYVEGAPRRQRIAVEQQGNIARLKRASAQYAAAFQVAQQRLRHNSADHACSRGEPGADAVRALYVAGPSLPSVVEVPPELSAEIQRQERMAQHLKGADNNPPDGADEQDLITRIGTVEESARLADKGTFKWIFAVVVNERVPATLKPADPGPRYEPGHIDGTAFLYSIDAAAFVCMGRFHAQNSKQLKLETTRPRERPRYDSRLRRTVYESYKEPTPMSDVEAEEALRQDLTDQLWSTVGDSLRPAELAPEPSPPPKGRKAGAGRSPTL